jgi:hypothetical protein
MPANAQWSASIPLFTACMPATPPQLPLRWRAVGLMLPFQRGQIDIGEFVYDGALPAMRATVYGLESGAVDLLITQNATYQVHGPHDSPTYCSPLGAKLQPPSAQWLSSDSVCVGQSPLGNRALQWWKKPGFEPARYWFSADTRLPWRSSFVSRSFDPAIIGDYAMTYFPVFTPLPQTNLTSLRNLCAATAKPTPPGDVSATPTARELMELGNKAAELERLQRIHQLIPGLSQAACSRMTPVRWPDRFVTTAMVTPIQITDYAYSTLMYYDWNDADTQLVLPFHGSPPVLQGIISLKNRIGYRLKFSSIDRKPGACAAVLPGIVRPDWMTVASCKCRGVLDRNSALGANEDSQILSCPIKVQDHRVMWSWYTTQGKPIMFLEAAPEGTGVMLADYYDWIPGQTGRAGDFKLPQTCEPRDGSATAPAAGAAPTFSNVSCSDCHTTHFSGR